MVETLAYISADPQIRREMLEEYWAAQNEIIWGNQVATLTKEIVVMAKEISAKDKEISAKDKEISAKDKEISAKDKENEKLRRLLERACIDIPFD